MVTSSSSDPESEPEELSEIDKELARKMRELKQIQKQILYKKTTIAVKTTDGNSRISSKRSYIIHGGMDQNKDLIGSQFD